MGVLRSLAVLVGVLALSAAIGLLVAPETLADAGVGEAVEGVPIDRVAKLGLGLAFGALALFAGMSRAETGYRSLPTPERVGATRATAGEEIDAALERAAEDGERGERARISVRREIRTVAVETLVDAADLDEDEAKRRLETGEWTDDPRAAAFLGSDVARPPLRLRLRDWLSADPSFERRARATVDEIAARRADR